MFKKTTGLTISGGIFKNPTTFENILSNRMNLLYGRNGSGKSTIARAFMQAKDNPGGVHDYNVSFVGTGELPSPSDKGIFVFNEDFIDRNFKLQDNLKAIVMLGKNAQLDGPIKEAEKNIRDLQEELKRLRNEAEPYDAKSGDKSVAAADKKIKDDLKVKYLPRITEISGGVKLTQTLIDAVLKKTLVKPSGFQSVADLSNDIDARLQKYLSCKSGSSISWTAPSFGIDLDAVNSLLGKVVQPSGLTAEDSAMLDFLTGSDFSGDNYLDRTQDIIISGGAEVCPLCHQRISHSHRDMLAARLERFRDKQTEDFKNEISSVSGVLHPVSDLLPDFPIKDYEGDIAHAKECIEKMNAFIDKIKLALESKSNTPYAASDAISRTDYESLVSELNSSFSMISEDVKAFNESVKENDQLLIGIKEDNITQALWEYESDIARYRANEAARDKLVGENGNGGEYGVTNNKLTAEKGKLASLRLQSEPIGEAVNIINHYLRLIFGRDRLQLDAYGKDKYKILSRGSEVPPKAVSAGERNAIALAYFFACVVEQKVEGYDYSEPTMLVIDDPISSFDSENKAGIISLLDTQCRKILAGNDDSKILILTHDLTTLKNLIDIKEKVTPEDDKNCCILENKGIIRRFGYLFNDMTDYRRRLLRLYDFANLEVPSIDNEDTSIGNMARRLLEQYASFRYSRKWECLFSDEDILANLPEDRRDIFRDLNLRPALNPESHGTDLVLAPSDLQRTVRTVLAYLYLTDKTHLKSYLTDKREGDSRIVAIAKWAQEV